jgi:hypothetical protein
MYKLNSYFSILARRYKKSRKGCSGFEWEANLIRCFNANLIAPIPNDSLPFRDAANGQPLL